MDFLIRTSGEIRVSNFMLFSLAYAEMYFPLTYFPDFKEDEFDKALEEYTKEIDVSERISSSTCFFFTLSLN